MKGVSVFSSKHSFQLPWGSTLTDVYLPGQPVEATYCTYSSGETVDGHSKHAKAGLAEVRLTTVAKASPKSGAQAPARINPAVQCPPSTRRGILPKWARVRALSFCRSMAWRLGSPRSSRRVYPSAHPAGSPRDTAPREGRRTDAASLELSRRREDWGIPR